MTPAPLCHPTPRRWLRRGARILLVVAGVALTGIASRVVAAESSTEFSLRVLDRMLADTAAGSAAPTTRVYVGDQGFTVDYLRRWREVLAARSAVPDKGVIAPESAFASAVSIDLWPGGVVPYVFEAVAPNAVSPARQQAFLDAVGEIAAFANIQFVPRGSETNYVRIRHVPGLGGGQADVGMIGGEQLIDIGSWNRGTLVHEIGHCLGLIHEHQRSDRDAFVAVVSTNIQTGAELNFVLIGDSANFGPYDFASTMHYSRNALSNGGGDTLVPTALHASWLNIMGVDSADRALSAGDRAGLADPANYGPPVVPPGPVVTNTHDSGSGSLRAAIYHAWDHPGTMITFNIPTSDPGYSGGVFTIHPSDVMTRLGPSTTIDATTQAINQGDTNPAGPEIVLSGANAEAGLFVDGLHLRSSFCTVRALTIQHFEGHGIRIAPGPSSVTVTGNVVAGCYLGTQAAGSIAAPNGGAGVRIENGASNNTIGGPAVGDRNVISGNSGNGVTVTGVDTNNNTIAGNFLGLDASGTTALPNGFSGIEVLAGPAGTLIGGATSGARNVISGNATYGIVHAAATGTRIEGNWVGTTATGLAARPNATHGVGVFLDSSDVVVGGATPGRGNVISGNTGYGVIVSGATTTGVTIAGNFIGLGADGVTVLPNTTIAVGIFGGAHGNLVGGSVPAARNFIAGNLGHGVLLAEADTTANIVAGNFIGLKPDGSAAGNAWSGIAVQAGAHDNLVGGANPGTANRVAHHFHYGIVQFDAPTVRNTFSGNESFANAFGNVSVWDASNAGISPPLLSSAALESTTHVTGSFTVNTAGSHRVEFFADPGGLGEARTFVGAINDSDGSFDANLSALVPAGTYVAATVTDPEGNTSALSFSQWVGIDDLGTDNDGIPNSYEITHGLDPNVDDANGDDDSDGQTNLAEFHAGTDPQSALSRFGPLVVVMTAGGAEVTLPDAVAGKNHGFEYSDDLLVWHPFAIGLVPSVSGPLTILDPTALTKPRRFFRAAIVP